MRKQNMRIPLIYMKNLEVLRYAGKLYNGCKRTYIQDKHPMSN